MKKCLRILVLVCTVVYLFCGVSFAAETSFNIDYSNRYIWRGFDLNPDNKFVIQPSVDFTFGESPWSLNLWYSHSNENNDLNEIDLTVNYTFPGGKDVEITAGMIHYGWYWVDNFKEENNTTLETFVTFAWKNLDLNPEFSLYHDNKNGNGLYAQLALSKEFKLSEKQTIELSSSIGYNQKQWINKSGLSDVNLRLSVPLNDGKITPFFAISWPLMKEINPDVAREYWMGLSLSF